MNSSELDNQKYVLATFYRAGELALRQLLNIGVPKDNILCVTYDDERNNELTTFLENKDINYTTDQIGQDYVVGRIENFEPDILCSLYYRDIIPEDVLNIPKYRAFNFHPSLLPNYRGVLSVPWAIFNEDSETGFTYHYMTDEIDQGPILSQRSISISNHDTAYSLYHRILHAGMVAFLPALQSVLDGEEGYPQDGGGSYHSRGELPNEGAIDDSWSEDKIDRFIRAMYFPPFDPATVEFEGEEYNLTSVAEYNHLRKKYSKK